MTRKGMKRQATDWEKIFAKPKANNFHMEYIKNYQNSTRRQIA
jgi:hypothetical protein